MRGAALSTGDSGVAAFVASIRTRPGTFVAKPATKYALRPEAEGSSCTVRREIRLPPR